MAGLAPRGQAKLVDPELAARALTPSPCRAATASGVFAAELWGICKGWIGWFLIFFPLLPFARIYIWARPLGSFSGARYGQQKDGGREKVVLDFLYGGGRVGRLVAGEGRRLEREGSWLEAEVHCFVSTEIARKTACELVISM